ncbi:hypothetical protein AGMMS49953_03920 [Endomicrobiia bacterium]|uniref:hypothetical protein n=1 Tax=Endomicrobium trichonymphae TaxID=1408204 RepID=UPI0011EA6D2A|nr:hypothetical protein [Candidatus Endomicrobium trichonymphae]GHT23409.1 hypothetical protein AGMMS49953_03920 [Endomicrobiia bacterium]
MKKLIAVLMCVLMVSQVSFAGGIIDKRNVKDSFENLEEKRIEGTLTYREAVIYRDNIEIDRIQAEGIESKDAKISLDKVKKMAFLYEVRWWSVWTVCFLTLVGLRVYLEMK